MRMNMDQTLLELASYLGTSGYYARTPQERSLCQSLVKRSLLTRKRGTKQVYVVTGQGQSVVARKPLCPDELHGHVTEAFQTLRSPVRPFVPIKDIKTYVQSHMTQESSAEEFDAALLELHHSGKVTLEPPFTAEDDSKALVEDQNGTRYYYVLDVSPPSQTTPSHQQ